MSITTTDPIADMLSRLRNAIAVNKTEVNLPHSKIKESVAKLLSDNGFIQGVSVSGTGVAKSLKLTISADGTSPITEIVRLSTPGRRHYVGVNDIPIVKRGRGIVVLSTSKGIMTGTEASKQRIGGELICRVY
ncbi:30S ribosomal protein S8 [Candidatus Saccharibacteria bacterium RIFCSPHIGHO2_02_FULL_47_12]|nr:MAG: 30S ribosomal protein S8 [Candidatus Saccharibacteria bacterium RIFCSPHIGHO2_02_FULL_47_12]